MNKIDYALLSPMASHGPDHYTLAQAIESMPKIKDTSERPG